MFKTEKQINEAKAALQKGVIVYYFNEAAMNAHIGIVVDTDPEYYSGEGVSVMLVDRNLKPSAMCSAGSYSTSCFTTTKSIAYGEQ